MGKDKCALRIFLIFADRAIGDRRISCHSLVGGVTPGNGDGIDPAFVVVHTYNTVFQSRSDLTHVIDLLAVLSIEAFLGNRNHDRSLALGISQRVVVRSSAFCSH